MEVILLERVEKLGQMGDLVTVKPGYARNFLLPKGKALRATAANKERFEADRAKLEAENLARKSDAEKVAAKMEGMTVVLIRAASEMGQLYGSASSRDIADQINAADVAVNRNQIDLNTAIKTLGLFPVRVVLHPEVTVEVTVNIARSADEATEQQKLGRAIISDIAERERAEAAEAALDAEERMAEMFEEEALANLSDKDGAAAESEAGAADGDGSEAGADSPAEDAGAGAAEGKTKAKKAKSAAAAKGKAKAKAKAKAGASDDDGGDEAKAETKAKAKKTASAASAKAKKKAKKAKGAGKAAKGKAGEEKS